MFTRRATLLACVFLAGSAALSWEVIWQLEASLAIGVSALGTAITLATVMGGMTAGSLAMGRLLERLPGLPAAGLYAALEATIGVSGLLLKPGFAALEALDATVWASAPAAAPVVQLIGIAGLLGLPTLAMGATLPVLGLLARAHRLPLSLLYGLNVAGACLGTLFMAFGALPALGVSGSIGLLVAVDLGVALAAAVALRTPAEASVREAETPEAGPVDLRSYAVVFTSGLAVFALEVVWFRALRAALLSTTDGFAIMLAAV
ncbi:MAG: hypothetical protein AAF211_05720, partial [Myxococcota bacterium]